jgi:hypothetical protein
MKGTTQIKLLILGMTCVPCAETLQEHLKAMPGSRRLWSWSRGIHAGRHCG